MTLVLVLSPKQYESSRSGRSVQKEKKNDTETVTLLPQLEDQIWPERSDGSKVGYGA
jgi:hypothetical protein